MSKHNRGPSAIPRVKMTDTRKLKWEIARSCGSKLTGLPVDVYCHGAAGRRCAEAALVYAGVITQAEADELVWREYRPWAVAGRDFSSDDAGHGLTQEEWGEWADRRTALGISIDPWGWKGDSQ